MARDGGPGRGARAVLPFLRVFLPVACWSGGRAATLRGVLTLTALLTAAGLEAPPGLADPVIERAVYDSRRAGPGALFVAVGGTRTDGHAHALDAVRRGAAAVVAERPPEPALPPGTPLVLVADSRAALAPLAARLCGDPSRRLTVAGVTGTDGKTTTVTMLHAAWRGAGIGAAALSTLDFRTLDRVEPNTSRQTTLESADLHPRFGELLAAGCTHVALETSSHALELNRVDEVDFDAAVYTRITSEHLDFHGSREAYLEAKARLAAGVAARAGGLLVLDRDDGFGFPRLDAVAAARRLTYSAAGDPGADLRATRVDAGPEGVRLAAETPWGDVEVQLRLAGRFNAANALAALAAACATGARLEDAAAGLERLERVGGRMERVDLGQPFGVVIDYAHTAEALRTVLGELRAATRGRLWAVFGSAGERDAEKRPAMGEVAGRLADAVVLTDEDPRGEDRHQILEEIAAGARAAGMRRGDTLVVVPDRAGAVAHAVEHARPGDTVLLAGKGHESCILTAEGSVPWDERAVAEEAVRRWLVRHRD
ncbi:MAG: UDP-N-acetylmuramoyl-L-alanyl-D-glutamate--2,6-diaminopimelate ligase [Chloroflexota bacterium]|nr:UDP-N-acetylmuramoyl-L-alanyl-D-glutamate--2,6-diaminopimelate ligase [Chloroflexota bacterium]